MKRIRRRYSWELLLLLVLVAAVGWSTSLSPYYLHLAQILGSAQYFLIFGILACGLMVVLVIGEIDISLTSTLGVATVTFAKLASARVPLYEAVVIVFAIAGVLGLVNGILVVYAKLPSLAVTVGTYGAYEGLAYIIGGSSGIAVLRPGYTYIGSAHIGEVPFSVIVFFGMVILTGLLMGITPFGRYCYAIGANANATRMAGVATNRVRLGAFVFAGLAAGLGAFVWIGQYYSAQADNANGDILFVLTAVVLGGVRLEGGRGSAIGVMLGTLVLGTISNGMGLANYPGAAQSLLQGGLLAGPQHVGRSTAPDQDGLKCNGGLVL